MHSGGPEPDLVAALWKDGLATRLELAPRSRLEQHGIEFPAAMQFGDVGRSCLRAPIAHELAHQWFYAHGYRGGPAERAAAAEQADVWRSPLGMPPACALR